MKEGKLLLNKIKVSTFKIEEKVCSWCMNISIVLLPPYFVMKDPSPYSKKKYLPQSEYMIDNTNKILLK